MGTKTSSLAKNKDKAKENEKGKAIKQKFRFLKKKTSRNTAKLSASGVLKLFVLGKQGTSKIELLRHLNTRNSSSDQRATMKVNIKGHTYTCIFENHCPRRMGLSKTDGVILLYDSTNTETFELLPLYFEELLFHCSDGLSDHVVTAVVRNEANETPTGSTIMISREQRVKLIRDLIQRREKTSNTLRDTLKERTRARIISILIFAERKYGNNVVYPMMQWLREEFSIHRRLVFGSLNTKTGNGVRTLVERLCYKACLRNQVDFVLKIIEMRNLLRQMNGWKVNYGIQVSQNQGNQMRMLAEAQAESSLEEHFGERAVNLLRFWNDIKRSKFGWRRDYSGIGHEMVRIFKCAKRREVAEMKATEYVLDQLPVSPKLCFTTE